MARHPPQEPTLDGANIIRTVFQRLHTLAPGAPGDTVKLVPDAASNLKQVSPTAVEFTLKPGQTFTSGYGEMTADDVKFSYERCAVASVDGHKGDWVDPREVELAPG